MASIDAGGSESNSAQYANNGGIGDLAGLSSVSFPPEIIKSGYVGQLYRVTGLTMDSSFADNGTTQQLSAFQTLDDGTLLNLIAGSDAWSVVAGQLPAGLYLNMATGVISGTPSGSGDYSFEIKVTDNLGDSAVQTFSGGSVPPAAIATDTPTMPPLTIAALAMFLLLASQSWGRARVS